MTGEFRILLDELFEVFLLLSGFGKIIMQAVVERGTPLFTGIGDEALNKPVR